MKKDKFANLRKLSEFNALAKIINRISANDIQDTVEYKALFKASTKNYTDYDSIECQEMYALDAMIRRKIWKNEDHQKAVDSKVQAYKNIVKAAYDDSN